MGIRSEILKFGKLPCGQRDLITDVPGVKVGHVTLADGEIQTGVTAVIPGEGSAFRNKFPAAVHVINGFGKSAGLMQVRELGNLESPIILTNTFSVAACTEGLLDVLLPEHPEIGISTGTLNTVVTECNDGHLNRIRDRSVRPEHVRMAMEQAGTEFAEGAVGAGRGMICYGWKGGIGSASRVVTIGENIYMVGALLLTNFGEKGDLVVCGRHITDDPDGREDKGSCIMVLATDLPLSTHQLERCAHRAQNGIARTGSYTGNGSGEVVIMFSTANRIPHRPEEPLQTKTVLHDDYINRVFCAVTECVEESVVSSLLHADTVTGREGNTVYSLRDSGLVSY